MFAGLKPKAKAVGNFALDRLKEASTWQAIGFVVALSGSHFGASLDWGQGAALGGLVSAAIKAVTPDNKGSGDAN